MGLFDDDFETDGEAFDADAQFAKMFGSNEDLAGQSVDAPSLDVVDMSNSENDFNDLADAELQGDADLSVLSSEERSVDDESNNGLDNNPLNLPQDGVKSLAGKARASNNPDNVEIGDLDFLDLNDEFGFNDKDFSDFNNEFNNFTGNFNEGPDFSSGYHGPAADAFATYTEFKEGFGDPMMDPASFKNYDGFDAYGTAGMGEFEFSNKYNDPMMDPASFKNYDGFDAYGTAGMGEFEFSDKYNDPMMNDPIMMNGSYGTSGMGEFEFSDKYNDPMMNDPMMYDPMMMNGSYGTSGMGEFEFSDKYNDPMMYDPAGSYDVAGAYDLAGTYYDPAGTYYDPAGTYYDPAGTYYDPAAYGPAGTGDIYYDKDTYYYDKDTYYYDKDPYDSSTDTTTTTRTTTEPVVVAPVEALPTLTLQTRFEDGSGDLVAVTQNSNVHLYLQGESDSALIVSADRHVVMSGEGNAAALGESSMSSNDIFITAGKEIVDLSGGGSDLVLHGADGVGDNYVTINNFSSNDTLAIEAFDVDSAVDASIEADSSEYFNVNGLNSLSDVNLNAYNFETDVDDNITVIGIQEDYVTLNEVASADISKQFVVVDSDTLASGLALNANSQFILYDGGITDGNQNTDSLYLYTTPGSAYPDNGSDAIDFTDPAFVKLADINYAKGDLTQFSESNFAFVAPDADAEAYTSI